MLAWTSRTATKPPNDNYRDTIANSNKVSSLERVSAASQAPAGVRPQRHDHRPRPRLGILEHQLGPDLARQHLGERAPEGFAGGRGGAEADAVVGDDDPALRADRDRDVAAALVREGMAERVRDELVDQERDRRGVALGDLEPREVEPDRDPPRVDAGRDLAGEILHEGADVEASGRVRRIEQAVRRRQRRDALRHGKQAAARLGALRAARLEEDDRGERLQVVLGEVIEFAQAPRPRLERCLELDRAAPDLILDGGAYRRGRGPARQAGCRLVLDAPRLRTQSLQHTPLR